MQLQGLEAAYFAILLALVVQFLWLTLKRRGANAYISAITEYREPNSALGRAYGWSIRSVTNSLLEGLLLISTIFFVVALYSFSYATSETISMGLTILALVFLLSGVISLQIRRVYLLLRLERGVVRQMTASTDKIGAARTVVQRLIDEEMVSDGRLWFILFRLASNQDQIGWSVRDVLMEKSKEIDGLRAKRSKSKQQGQSQGGAEIK